MEMCDRCQKLSGDELCGSCVLKQFCEIYHCDKRKAGTCVQCGFRLCGRCATLKGTMMFCPIHIPYP